ncbi:MAG: CBS domain-containing protein [bacterium]
MNLKPDLLQKERVTRVQELIYEMKIGEVMTQNVITVSPQTPMNELRAILRDHRLSGVPVLDEGKLVGIVSIEDFIKYLSQGAQDELIERRMTREVRTLHPDDPLIVAVEAFDHYGFGRFPVVERGSDKLVGIITKGDIIRGLLRKLEIDFHQDEISRWRASHFFEDVIADRTTLIFEYDVTGGDFKRAGSASSGLKTTLRRLGIKPQLARRVAIASYEAEMNIVVFTPKGKIAAYIDPHQIRLVADDQGPGIPNIEKALQPGFSTAPDWVRELGFGAGMGLNNIQKCSDVMNLSSQINSGTHLEAIFYNHS